jgi:hypothetical protein
VGTSTLPGIATMYGEIEMYLTNIGNITDKIEVAKAKGNVADDTVADIDKVQEVLNNASTKIIALNFLVRYFLFIVNFI